MWNILKRNIKIRDLRYHEVDSWIEWQNYFNHKKWFEIENFINFKVDAEKAQGLDLAIMYMVSSYPTLLFLDDQGNVLERKDGLAFHEELISMADSALSMQSIP